MKINIEVRPFSNDDEGWCDICNTSSWDLADDYLFEVIATAAGEPRRTRVAGLGTYCGGCARTLAKALVDKVFTRFFREV